MNNNWIVEETVSVGSSTKEQFSLEEPSISMLLYSLTFLDGTLEGKMCICLNRSLWSVTGQNSTWFESYKFLEGKSYRGRPLMRRGAFWVLFCSQYGIHWQACVFHVSRDIGSHKATISVVIMNQMNVTYVEILKNNSKLKMFDTMCFATCLDIIT